MVVEAEDVQFLEIAEIATDDGHAVRIDGLLFHSSYAVEHIEQSRAMGDIILEIFMIPAKEGLSGRFKLEVPLADDLKRILFGPERTQIWPAVN